MLITIYVLKLIRRQELDGLMQKRRNSIANALELIQFSFALKLNAKEP